MNLPEFRNSAGERLDVSFHPGSREDSLVILGHGLTGNKDRPLLVALANGLAERGWPCMRFSYAGSGASEGLFEDMTITKEVGDLRSILDALPPNLKIAYCGHSMGGAVGVLTAAEDDRIRVLITLAGMVYTANFVEREFDFVTPGLGCMWDEPEHPLTQGFVDDLEAIDNTLEAASKIVAPWLLIHGSQDDIIPVLDSEDAHDATHALKKLVEIETAGHVFDDASYPRLIDEIDVWLATYLK
jgi:pimeloyl-ACP methyl ester carboxylesterase